MKNLLHRLFTTLNINGRDWVVLLLALLLAFSTWLIHNLALKYNAFLDVNVSALCNIEGHSNESFDDAEVSARCRATGYRIIASNLRRGRVVKVQFDPSVMQHYADDRFFVTSDKLSEYSHIIFGDEVAVEYFVSDTLFFRFPKVNSKRVPVVPVSSFSFRDQYINTSELEISPDSVTVYGEPFLLDNITAAYTAPINYTDVADDIHGIVKLDKIKGVRMSVQEAHYSLDVARYVDLVVSAPVQTVNVPSGKDLIVLPSKVTLTMKCEFPLLESQYKDLNVVVDYNDFRTSITGKCVVSLPVHPKGLIGYETDPVAVSCVEESR